MPILVYQIKHLTSKTSTSATIPGQLKNQSENFALKRLTRKQKERHQKRARDLNERRLVSNYKRLVIRRRDSHNSEIDQIRHLAIQGKAVWLKCPENLCLDDNYEEVMSVVQGIREHGEQKNRSGIYIDFKGIRRVTPSGALVLAAEIDRWNITNSSGSMKAIDVKEWDPGVRSLLAEMGFFELLHVKQKNISNLNVLKNVTFVRFQSGIEAIGEVVERMRDVDLLHLNPRGVPAKYQLYDAITEAMVNVTQHAYKGQQVYPLKKWWLSASYDSEKHEVTVMFMDQGDGIPSTLPRSKHQEVIRNALGIANWAMLKDHAKLIKAAHDVDRSATGMEYRGHGLQRNIRSYIAKSVTEGRYKVFSGKGEYTYYREGSGDPKEELREHKYEFKGTFVEWLIKL